MVFKSALQLIGLLGIDPRRGVDSLRGLPTYVAEFIRLRRQLKMADAGDFRLGRPYPCLGDRLQNSGVAKGHYFHQDLLVASRIFAAQPTVHLDVGSRVDGFVAHVACFRKITVVDIRPRAAPVPNIEFLLADLMADLPPHMRECCDSLSCLHALEHFGLGRYGDDIRWDGHRIGYDNLIAMLQTGGRLYLSVPIGPQRIEFNAHRVFSIDYLLGMFSSRMRVDRFSFVDDQGDLHDDIVLDGPRQRFNCGCTYGCGIFELTKLS